MDIDILVETRAYEVEKSPIIKAIEESQLHHNSKYRVVLTTQHIDHVLVKRFFCLPDISDPFIDVKTGSAHKPPRGPVSYCVAKMFL